MPNKIFSFKKAQRIVASAEFKQLYRSQQRGGGKHFSYHVEPSALPTARLGVTVSKKVSKSAVVRNRIKRQVREFFRVRQSQLSGANIVITAKPACAGVDDSERVSDLTGVWTKLQKWRAWHYRDKAQKKINGH